MDRSTFFFWCVVPEAPLILLAYFLPRVSVAIVHVTGWILWIGVPLLAPEIAGSAPGAVQPFVLLIAVLYSMVGAGLVLQTRWIEWAATQGASGAENNEPAWDWKLFKKAVPIPLQITLLFVLGVLVWMFLDSKV